MPLYMTNAVAGAIDDAAKAKIAADITRIHCEATGAPPRFVQAFFFEDAPHMPLGERRAMVFGGIRAGRDEAQRARIMSEISRSLGVHAGLAPESVTVELAGTPASWAMEDGAVMPEPGEEAAWLAVHGGG